VAMPPQQGHIPLQRYYYLPHLTTCKCRSMKILLDWLIIQNKPEETLAAGKGGLVWTVQASSQEYQLILLSPVKPARQAVLGERWLKLPCCVYSRQAGLL